MINFACPKCGKAYSRSESAAGGKFFCNNASCGQKIQIPTPQDVGATVGGIPLPRTESHRPGEWFFDNKGQQSGPHTLADMKHLVKTGQLLPSTPVWTDGLPDWQPASIAMPTLFTAAGKKNRQVVVEESSEEGEHVRSRWEVVGFAFFALVAAGILAALAIVLIPKIRGTKTDDGAKKDDNPNSAIAQSANPNDKPIPPKPEEVFARWKPSVALIKNRNGSGTGFLLDNRLVVTNSHVMEGDTLDGFELSFPSSANGRETYRFRMLYQDPKRDLAILQLNDKISIPPMRLCPADAVEGEPIVIIGSPGVAESKSGLSVNAFCDGKIASLRFEDDDGSIFVQHHSDAGPGNSGSPLLNLKGEVVAVHVRGTKDRQRVKLAIPLPALRAALEKASGRTTADATRVTAMHDAHALFINLLTACVAHNKGMELVIENAEQLEGKTGQRGSRDSIQISKQVTRQVLQEKNQTFIADNLHQQYARFYEDRLSAILTNAVLDEVLRRKLREVRDEYLGIRGLFDSPPLVTIMEYRQRKELALSRLNKLAGALSRDFAKDF